MESYQGTYYSKQSCLAWSLGTGCCLTEQSEINVIRFEGAGLDGNIVCGSVYYIFTNHSLSFAYERSTFLKGTLKLSSYSWSLPEIIMMTGDFRGIHRSFDPKHIRQN